MAAVLLLLLPAVLPAHGHPMASAVRIRFGTYAGRHDRCPRFEEVFANLEDRVDRNLAFVCDALGLLPGAADGEPTLCPERARIHVQVRDADFARWGGDRARCRTVCVRGKGDQQKEHQQIDLYAEYFISGDSDLDRVLRHELVHALMRARMGRRKYEALPHWIREGLAVHVAEEGRDSLRRTLLAREDVDALMTGLMSKRRRLLMYPYAWLGVEYLRETGGLDAVPSFARRLMAGEPPRRLIRRLTGRSWKTFEAELRDYARRRIEAEATGIDEIREARALYRARDHEAAREAFLAFLGRYPDSAFAPTARYYMARSLYRERRYEEAAATFAACIETDRGISGWYDECHLFLGIAHYERGRDQEAVAILRDYLELHPYSDQHDLGYLALGRALDRLGRCIEARGAFEAVAGARKVRGPQRIAAARELASFDEP